MAKIAIYGLIFLLCFCSSGKSEGNSMPKGEYRLEDLGFASRAVSYDNNFAVLAPAQDGKGSFFYVSYYRTDGHAELLAYNWRTEERRRYESGSSGLYGLLRASDGTIYAGGINGGTLYALRPGSDKLEALGGVGEPYIWDITETPDGKIYGGCYGKSRLLEYDPKTQACKDLGRMSEERDYLRYLSAAPDGRIWCCVSHPGLFFIYDPKTGAKKQVLPEEYHSNSFCGPMRISGKYVYVIAGKGENSSILIYDTETGNLLRRIDQMGRIIPGDYTSGIYLYDSEEATLRFYEAETDNLKKLLEDQYLGECKWLEANRYMHGLLDQDYYCYDLKERKFLARTRLTPPDGEGMGIFPFCSGPDGNIYGGVYINQHLWKADAATGEIVEMGRHRIGGGQIDSAASGGGLVWLGSYTRAHIAAYDPQKAWNPGPRPENNPRDYGSVGAGQYRTRCILYGPDGKVYLGSYPSYSSAETSAMSVLDPKTGEVENYTNLDPKCLAAGKELVFGSSGGNLFAFDPQKKEVIFSTAGDFSTMVGLPDGRIACAGGAVVSIFDPIKQEFALRKDLGLGSINTLILGQEDALYGISDKAVFRINAGNLSSETLHEGGGKYLAEDRSGNLYFARGARLFRLVRE